MPMESPGLKAAASDKDEYQWNSTTRRGCAALSSKGMQGRAALSMALDDEPIFPLTGPSPPEGFQTTCGWIPFRDTPDLPGAGEGGGGVLTVDEAPWKLVKWSEVPTNWVNGFSNLEEAILALCLPDQEETLGYASFFRATNTDQRLTACVDPHFDQVYGVETGISCLSILATTGKPSLHFCLLAGVQ